MSAKAPHKLKRWRMGRGFTHREAGAHFGATRVTWFRWESGAMIPGPATMIEFYAQGIAEPNDFYDLPPLRVSRAA